ncbi:MAG TPA: ATP-binding protein [Burkholderiales bacterium]|nr:ATP-binding protein [Burkholderiales bacterium]
MISTVTVFNTKVLAQESNFCDKHKLPYLKSLFDLPNGNRWIGCCSACFDTAKIAEIKATTIKNEQEYKQQIINKLFDRAAIPPRFEKVTFANYIVDNDNQLNVKKLMQDFADNISDNLKIGRNVIISGNIGNGKNHLAIATAKVAIENGYIALFTTVGEMIDKVNAGNWNKDGTINKYTVPDLLILDEVTFGLNSVEQSHLFKVITRRYELMKSTIILSNLSIKELATKEALSERIVDRLRENNGILLNCTWKSYRK